MGDVTFIFLLDDWVGASLFCSLFHRVSGLVFNKESSVKDCYAFERNNEYWGLSLNEASMNLS